MLLCHALLLWSSAQSLILFFWAVHSIQSKQLLRVSRAAIFNLLKVHRLWSKKISLIKKNLLLLSSLNNIWFLISKQNKCCYRLSRKWEFSKCTWMLKGKKIENSRYIKCILEKSRRWKILIFLINFVEKIISLYCKNSK